MRHPSHSSHTPPTPPAPTEGKLEKAFSQAFETFKANGGKDAGYVAFDFHKQCGAKNYERMSVLWDQVNGVGSLGEGLLNRSKT